MKDNNIECPYCEKEVHWSDVQTNGEPASVSGMLRFLLRETEQDFSDWNITEVYYFECNCGRGFVAAEVPDACIDSSPAYLTVGLHGDLGPGERMLPLRVEKITKNEVRLMRDSLKVVK